MATSPFPFLQCCTENCLEELKNYIGPVNYDVLRDKGLVEYSAVYGGSFVCRLLRFKDEVNMSLQEFLEIGYTILDKGLVIHCNENGMTTLSSVETFLKFGEKMGLVPPDAVPA